MANLFWVGGTATWDATAGTKWASTSGGAGGQPVPTAADDVFLDAASGAVTVTTSGTVVMRSVDCTGFTGTLTVPSGNPFTVGDGSGGAVKFVAGMTLNQSATLTLASTSSNSGTGWPITSGGKNIGTVVCNGVGGKWVLQDALNIGTGSITVTNGAFFGNGQTINCASFSSTNSNIRTIDITNCSITLTGANATVWTCSTSTNLTFVGTGSTITCNGATATFIPGTTPLYNTVVMSGAGIASLGSGGTYANFTRTGTAVKTDVLAIGTTTVNGTLTISGNSVTNRLLVNTGSTLVGSTRVVTCDGTVAVSNSDFMDITGAGTASWDLSAVTGLSGDCGHNIGITFTTPVTQTHTSSAGGNWSDVTKWTSRVPLPQDDVVVDVNTTGTLTNDMPRFGANLDFTGFSGTLAGAAVSAFFGSLTFSSTMTVSISSGASVTAGGRGTHTITMAGKTLGTQLNLTGPGGTYSLQDAFTTTQSLVPTDGTFNTNNNTVTCLRFTAASGRAQTVNLGTSTINITDTTASTLVNTSAGVATYSMSQATFVLTNASTGTRTFGLGSSHTIGAIVYTVANSPGILSIGSIGTTSTPTTVTTLTIGSGRGLQIQSGGQLNVTNWNVNGVNNGYVYIPGLTTTFASAPDSAPLQIAGDISLLIRVALDDWTPTVAQALINKYGGATNNRNYSLAVISTGILRFQWADGTTSFSKDSTVAPTVSDGSAIWLMVTHDVDNGAAGNAVKFFTAADQAGIPSSWTQLGSTVTTAGTTSRITSATQLRMGADSQGTPTVMSGKLYRGVIYSDITQTSKQFDADFTTKSFGANTFTESSTNAATVTINDVTAQAGDGRVALTSSTPSSAATLSSSGNQTSDYLTIQDSTAQGANWYAGLHSLNNGNNKGWIFNTLTPPSTNGNFTLFGGPN